MGVSFRGEEIFGLKASFDRREMRLRRKSVASPTEKVMDRPRASSSELGAILT